MATLLHAMGDVHPHAHKARLAQELSRLTFERWAQAKGKTGSRISKGKTIFCNSGFEAVEAALKTAMLATGKPGVIAFVGAYHGLGYGALNATQRDHFRAPFRSQLREFGQFVPFSQVDPGAHTRPNRVGGRQKRAAQPAQALETLSSSLKRLLRKHPIGAILVEPIQVRGGINIPPPDFLPLLRHVCDEHQILLILDEIYTGFGRTGKWFACEHSRTVPDLICLGKALTGGFPLSACIGREDLMDAAWPVSSGEAIHTSTFLGHPVGCAMALAQMAEIQRLNLVERTAELGEYLLSGLRRLCSSVNTRRKKTSDDLDTGVAARGIGLLAGLELFSPGGEPATGLALQATRQMLRRGFILLPEGEHSNVLALTPPLTIRRKEIKASLEELAEVLS